MADRAANEGQASTAKDNETTYDGPPRTHLQAIEVDSNTPSDDNDSTFESELGSTTSTSIVSSIRDYEYANGRRYHAYKRGAYLLPNDETEQDRLDLLHHVFLLALNG